MGVTGVGGEGGGGVLERLVPGACLLIPSVAQLQLSQTPRGNFEGTGEGREGFPREVW